MKTEYKCEYCGKAFETAKDAIACEKSHEAEKKKEGLREKSLEAINDLFNRHLKEFGEIPKITVSDENLKAATDALEDAGDISGTFLKAVRAILDYLGEDE